MRRNGLCRNAMLMSTVDSSLFGVVKAHHYIETVKKSKFLARVAPAATIDEALAILDQIKDP